MIVTLLAYVLLDGPDIALLDRLAQSRDATAIEDLADPALRGEFDFLKGAGAFGVGSLGWHAASLRDPGAQQQYVVFSTPLTTQDYGEFVFAWRNGWLAELIDERDDRGYQVLHYDFDLSFRPQEKKAIIQCAVTVTKGAEADQHAHFRLSPHYVVSSIRTRDGSDVPFDQAGGVVSVRTPQEKQFQLVFSYEGTVNLPRFAGAITKDEVMLTNDYWWPMIARGPATATISARGPPDWAFISHGEKVRDEVYARERHVTFEMHIPISYFSFSAGKFSHVSKKQGRITYSVWAREMAEEEMRWQLELMPPVLEFYERFAPYPFDTFAAVVTPLYGGGALEAYSYATYGTGWLPDEDAHEPGHTYWGGLIPNTYMNSFWNESFTSFSQGLFDREVAIGSTVERRFAFIQNITPGSAFRAAPLSDSGAFIGRNASSLGYGKGANVLQQLEFEIGTRPLVSALRAWLASHPAGQPGEWAGFEAAIADSYDEPLTWFFDQWVRQPGYPDFEISDIHWMDKGIEGEVQFFGDPYRIRCEVYAELVDGERIFTSVDLNPDRSDSSVFRIELPDKPVFISFDPYDRLPIKRGSETPMRISNDFRRLHPVQAKGSEDTLRSLGSLANMGRAVTEMPGNLNGHLIAGHPDEVDGLRELCARAGFDVEGDRLTYRGTTIDLNSGMAIALIELKDGGRCGIAVGRTKIRPNVGIARVALVDEYGRFLRGFTEPRRTGTMTFRLP
ncbi:MAG: hypothetical protein IH944_05170 [Armatimonadetes bacterium]|nr:hypothetical protein [Armatimonadota bacterium]